MGLGGTKGDWVVHGGACLGVAGVGGLGVDRSGLHWAGQCGTSEGGIELGGAAYEYLGYAGLRRIERHWTGRCGSGWGKTVCHSFESFTV